MPRLFVAVEIPDTVKERLEEIAYGLPGAVWTPPDHYHLTLRFIGEVGEETLADIGSALSTLKARSFTLAVKDLGFFPPRGEPQVLWAGLARSEALLRLRNKVESALVRMGQEPEGRKFSPHITLAKLRGTPAAKLAGYLQAHALFGAGDFPVTEFSLFSSILTPDGALHRLERTYGLEGLPEAEEDLPADPE